MVGETLYSNTFQRHFNPIHGTISHCFPLFKLVHSIRTIIVVIIHSFIVTIFFQEIHFILKKKFVTTADNTQRE
jgi:hypothetical protein